MLNRDFSVSFLRATIVHDPLDFDGLENCSFFEIVDLLTHSLAYSNFSTWFLPLSSSLCFGGKVLRGLSELMVGKQVVYVKRK